ncbi:UNVERIFIED_CONTAM: hypothetical protein Sindi_2555900 [Sesamum indicum]
MIQQFSNQVFLSGSNQEGRVAGSYADPALFSKFYKNWRTFSSFYLSIPSAWTAPPPGIIKLNVDAAIFKEESDFAVGVATCDSHGHCLAWIAIQLHRLLSPELRHGCTHITIETDCVTLPCHLVHSRVSSPVIGPIAHDILLLSVSFLSFPFSLVHKSGNELARSLARRASGRDECTTLLPFPSCELLLANLPSF